MRRAAGDGTLAVFGSAGLGMTSGVFTAGTCSANILPFFSFFDFLTLWFVPERKRSKKRDIC
jgi:hypothetical protein